MHFIISSITNDQYDIFPFAFVISAWCENTVLLPSCSLRVKNIEENKISCRLHCLVSFWKWNICFVCVSMASYLVDMSMFTVVLILCTFFSMSFIIKTQKCFSRDFVCPWCRLTFKVYQLVLGVSHYYHEFCGNLQLIMKYVYLFGFFKEWSIQSSN